MALGALNARTAQQRDDYGALSTGLCLCVCAAGLIAEDLGNAATAVIERSLRTSRRAPGAAARHVARAVGASGRGVVRNLDRVTDDGVLV
ncbi:hypothetical protein T261_00764 [Streptomyces lydicus]|nr:hypothetical protein T261_00764 [Streptomyces lydicus]